MHFLTDALGVIFVNAQEQTPPRNTLLTAFMHSSQSTKLSPDLLVAMHTAGLPQTLCFALIYLRSVHVPRAAIFSSSSGSLVLVAILQPILVAPAFAPTHHECG